ncbi:hypothetical protein FNF31_00715 [Cafeteria roenbergensis]|uniref:Amino acid transporter transmembrane domain-containing protein n=1 Tax=Cafeteria roenbergensis TaxID=33653 RepID=A0A5A8DV79_CAFRO|nr:hypothetical protein FNF31_00715 [Cafeteria roenbergensis]KAA0171678.1 hypothetical protein FNF28_00611 [Cafeteria roenbergensis]
MSLNAKSSRGPGLLEVSDGLWEREVDDEDDYGSELGGVMHAADTPFTAAVKAEAHPVIEGNASLRSTLFNTINAIVGAGVLALPYALRLDGAVVGTLLILLVAGLSERSAAMLLWVSDATKQRLYAGIGGAVGGPILGKVVDMTVVLQNLGLLIGYVVVCGDLIPEFVAYSRGDTDAGEGTIDWQFRAIILAVLSAVVFLPLSSLKSLDALRFTTIVGLVCVLVFVASAIALGSMTAADPHTVPCDATRGEIRIWPTTFVGVLQSAPLMFFSFVAHNTILLLYGELKRQRDPERESKFPSKRDKMNFVVRVSLVVCALLYGLSSLFSYSMFRDVTSQDVFVDFGPRAFPFMAWVKMAYAIVIIFSFPIIAFALRRSLHNLIFGTGHVPTTMHAVVESAFVVAISALVGIFVPAVSTVFGLTGALTATNIMYIFPAGFFLVLHARHKAQKAEDPTSVSLPEPPKGLWYWAVVVFCVGVFVFVGSTTGVILGMVSPAASSSCVQGA